MCSHGLRRRRRRRGGESRPRFPLVLPRKPVGWGFRRRAAEAGWGARGEPGLFRPTPAQAASPSGEAGPPRARAGTLGPLLCSGLDSPPLTGSTSTCWPPACARPALGAALSPVCSEPARTRRDSALCVARGRCPAWWPSPPLSSRCPPLSTGGAHLVTGGSLLSAIRTPLAPSHSAAPPTSRHDGCGPQPVCVAVRTAVCVLHSPAGWGLSPSLWTQHPEQSWQRGARSVCWKKSAGTWCCKSVSHTCHAARPAAPSGAHGPAAAGEGVLGCVARSRKRGWCWCEDTSPRSRPPGAAFPRLWWADGLAEACPRPVGSCGAGVYGAAGPTDFLPDLPAFLLGFVWFLVTALSRDMQFTH